MRIALITFEFPPAVAIGGIGTYAGVAARMLAEGGCDVEVFAAGPIAESTEGSAGIRIHRLPATDRGEFRSAVAPAFEARHRHQPFDLLESPEIGAEGALVANRFPEVATVVKLHTPTYMVAKSSWEDPGWAAQARFALGALRRGTWAFMKRPSYEAELDLECEFTRSADEIASPSAAIGERLREDWCLDAEKMTVFPLPLDPHPSLLDLPPPTAARTVGFIGRLEPRKGVLEFAQAIPTLLRRAPDLRFRFIGPTWPYRRTDMESWIRRRLVKYESALEFTGAVPHEALADELARCDMVVLPSRWESFGLVCPEAMSAARAVIGSASGGMAEMIEPGISGLLVPPRDPSAIARAVLSLVGHPDLVAALGKAGRRRALDLLSPARVLPKQLESYQKAMARRDARLGRSRLKG